MRTISSGKICNLFAKNFELVYLQNTSYFYHSIHFSKNLDTDGEDDIIRVMLCILKNKSIPDPDNLCVSLIKSCAFFTSEPLVTLFNQSIRNGIMSFLWKKTFITPVFKAGNSQDISNY